jgi:cohesin loading factor subunit SCC2
MAIANNFLSLSGNSQLIDHLIDFSRYQIVHTIFPAYDAIYRQIHKGAGAGEDEEEGDDYMDAPENGVGSAKKSRRKSKVSAKPKKTEANKVSGPVSIVLHKLCSVLALLKELLSVAKILDSTLLQLNKTMLETFGVDNIQLLQLKAIGVVCMVHPIPLFFFSVSMVGLPSVSFPWLSQKNC